MKGTSESGGDHTTTRESEAVARYFPLSEEVGILPFLQETSPDIRSHTAIVICTSYIKYDMWFGGFN